MENIEKNYLLWNIFRLNFSIWLWLSLIITHILVILGIGHADYDTNFVKIEEKKLIWQLFLNIPLQLFIICLSENWVASKLEMFLKIFSRNHILRFLSKNILFFYSIHVLYYLFCSSLNMEIAFFNYLEVNDSKSHFRIDVLWFSMKLFLTLL
jgi:hypothetical protein